MAGDIAVSSVLATNQMLAQLLSSELVYKNRDGKYSFATPLSGKFIRRQVQLPA